MKTLKNRICVVTGAGSGIGRETALLLAKEGAHLAIADVNEVGLQETRKQVESIGRPVSSHVVDVANKERMQAFVGEVLDAHGAVHVLVNNAGVSVTAPLKDQSLEDFEWLMGINFWGVVYGCKLFLPHLLAADEGHIVNLSSLFGLVGIPTQTSYCASKFAVRGFSEALRIELADSRVGVTSVHPGGIATNIAAAARFPDGPDGAKERARAIKMFQKMMPPSEAAARIVVGIKSNKQRVLITRETHVLDALKRIAPAYSTELVKWGFERMNRPKSKRA